MRTIQMYGRVAPRNQLIIEYNKHIIKKQLRALAIENNKQWYNEEFSCYFDPVINYSLKKTFNVTKDLYKILVFLYPVYAMLNQHSDLVQGYLPKQDEFLNNRQLKDYDVYSLLK